jgi:prophage regulatory protein
MNKRILRRPELTKKVGLCKVSIDNLVKSGEFPPPIKLGGTDSRAVGWIESEVDAWIDQKVTERDAEIAGGAA